MNNRSYVGAKPCPGTMGGKEVKTAWNGQLFAKQVMPFVDMTVKGWTWCHARPGTLVLCSNVWYPRVPLQKTRTQVSFNNQSDL